MSVQTRTTCGVPERDETKPEPPAPPDSRSTALDWRFRYPAGVSTCSTASDYMAAMQHTGLCVLLCDADRRTIVRYDQSWIRHRPRPDQPPERVTVTESAVRALLRRDAPILVTPSEARQLLATVEGFISGGPLTNDLPDDAENTLDWRLLAREEVSR